MDVNIIIPIQVYNLQLQQWQRDELYEVSERVYHPKYNGVISVVFHREEI